MGKAFIVVDDTTDRDWSALAPAPRVDATAGHATAGHATLRPAPPACTD